MVDHRGTLTGPEHFAVEFLAEGPALLGPSTGTTSRHRLPRLYDASNATIAAARLEDAVHTGRDEIIERTVDRSLVRRLAERGWVTVDAGGLVTLNPHRLTKPLPGGPGDGHAVVCSCGDTFESWDTAETHAAGGPS